MKHAKDGARLPIIPGSESGSTGGSSSTSRGAIGEKLVPSSDHGGDGGSLSNKTLVWKNMVGGVVGPGNGAEAGAGAGNHVASWRRSGGRGGAPRSQRRSRVLRGKSEDDTNLFDRSSTGRGRCKQGRGRESAVETYSWSPQGRSQPSRKLSLSASPRLMGPRGTPPTGREATAAFSKSASNGSTLNKTPTESEAMPTSPEASGQFEEATPEDIAGRGAVGVGAEDDGEKKELPNGQVSAPAVMSSSANGAVPGAESLADPDAVGVEPPSVQDASPVLESSPVNSRR